MLPHRVDVRNGDKRRAMSNLRSRQMKAASGRDEVAALTTSLTNHEPTSIPACRPAPRCRRPARAADPYDKVAVEANEKLVKLFGAGGYRGAESFGTGIIVSPQGHVLTAAAPFLDGRELRLHLPDGRKYAFKVKAIEPEFDAAVLEIVQPKKEAIPLELPYYDIAAAAQSMKVEPGTWVMALSNMYKVAERDEMMSVQGGRW